MHIPVTVIVSAMPYIPYPICALFIHLAVREQPTQEEWPNVNVVTL